MDIRLLNAKFKHILTPINNYALAVKFKTNSIAMGPLLSDESESELFSSYVLVRGGKKAASKKSSFCCQSGEYSAPRHPCKLFYTYEN